MAEFIFGLAMGMGGAYAMGMGGALIVVVGLFETGRLRVAGLGVADEALRRNDESRGVVRGPFQS